MRSLNRVELIGHLGTDPELRYTQGGDAVATLSIATNEAWTDKQTGEQQEQTEWHRVVLWRRLAEIANEYARKGSRIYVAGPLKTRKWQDQQGQDRYTTEVQGRDLLLLDPPAGRGDRTAPAPAGGASAPSRPRRPQYGPGVPAQAPADFDDDVPF
ncbi:single-stranded DNA-binding protein [Thiococcus pfennigii]|uniref:single-stranded DNA-binding protein n=1 Tax=Thiococcus pfennigii TaxID=1057 RepID=UPI001907834A|nr:single-stranded DNA-binding protein [Thiococcus pfennigii]MBK1732899.1 single-stranded DNA-binding protein [Thiococcus pfennigii]